MSFCCPCVRAASFPLVEMNFGTLGYTLSYDEYYSASQMLLRADGRYDSRAVTEITDFNAQTMTSYNSLTSSCTKYALTGSQNASLLYQPSYAILQLMNYSGIQWIQMVGGPNNVPAMIQDRNIPAIQYFVPRITILPNGTFCDVMGNCDAAGDDLSTPQYSFAELLDMATSPEGISETGATDEPAYTTVVSFSYFFQNGTEQGVSGAIPLRVELNGTRYIDDEAVETFYNIYDWINWRPIQTTAFTTVTSSSTYGTCASASSSYRAPFPNATSVEQTTIALGSSPSSSSFPSQFVMQVEGLIAQFSLNQRNGQGGGPGNGGNMGGPQLNSVQNYDAKWSYDSVGDQESVATYADNFTLAVNPTIYIYEYGSQYADGGEVWQVDGSASSGYTCVDAELTDYVENPLQSERGGVISFTQLFTNSSYDLSNFQYQGRSLQRGVPADWYRATFTNVYSTDTSYYGSLAFNYTANIYMYPAGWVFPGRANAADLQLPFRVVFQGMQRNLSSTNQTASVFTDAYNIFEFYPASDIMAAASGATLVSSSWFADSPANYGCPSYSTSSSSSSSSKLGGGAIAGIVIAVLVAVAVALVLILLCRRGNWSSGSKLFKAKSSSSSEGVTVAGGAGGSGKWKRQDEDFEPSTSRNDVELESTV